jgi:hypothetical protein
MARTATVYRTVGSVRRTAIPRSSRPSVSSTVFGRMLAKLSLADASLQRARPGRRGRA